MPRAGKRKDPNKPKGKKGAYIFFLEQRRADRKEEKLSFPDFSRETADEWRKLTAKQKEKFEKLALADKKRYEEEMAEYSPPSSDEEDEGKKKKRKKKEKDPNHPKRNMSSYFHFCGEKRAAVREDHQGASVGEIAKVMSEMWREITSKQKEKYEEKEKEEKTLYARNKTFDLPRCDANETWRSGWETSTSNGKTRQRAGQDAWQMQENHGNRARSPRPG